MDEGATYVLTIGDVVDPGDDTVSDYVINWGDDTETTISAQNLVAAGGVVEHVYADGDDQFVISASVTDEDGTFAQASMVTVAVQNVAPVAELAGDATVNEGSAYTLTIGDVVDPGEDTVTDYIIDWGDGSPSETLTAAELAAAGNTLLVSQA